MKIIADKKNNKEVSITISIQFSVFMAKKEIESGTEIPHEIIVAGCIEQLANKDYNIDSEEMIE